MEYSRKDASITQKEEKRRMVSCVDPRSERLSRYLDDHLTESSLCLLSLAEHMNMSIYAAGRLVKRTTGQSFRVYVTQKRLELACEQLRTTEYTVSRIARMVVFENPAYFSSVFKKYYGLSPISVKRNR